MAKIRKLDIPEGWVETTVGQLGKVKGGKRLPLGYTFADSLTKFPYLRVCDFENGSIDVNNLEYLPEKTQKLISNYIISRDDIYISIAGTIGIVGIIPSELDGANLTENAAKITNISRGFNQQFLMYFLNSHFVQEQIRSLMGITTQPKLALERIRQIKVIAPKYKEQQKIAEILSTCDEASDKIGVRIEKLKHIKQGLMQDLFRFGVDENGNPRTEKTHKLIEWKVRKSIQVLYMKGRIGWQGLKKDEFLEAGNYLVTGIHFNEKNRVSWEKCFRISDRRYRQAPEIQLRLKDVLITKDGTIGKVALIDYLPGNASLNSHLLVLRPLTNDIMPEFIYYQLFTTRFMRYIENIKTGSTLAGLTQKNFGNFELIIPSLKEQEQIVTMLASADEAIEKEIAYKNKLLAIKRGLMEDLLSGKVRVNHLIEKCS